MKKNGSKLELMLVRVLQDVGWLVGFYCISAFVGYLMPNQFLYNR